MAQQNLTARAFLTTACQGFVGAGRVVILAHAKDQLTAYPVPTSPKPSGPKDRTERSQSLSEPWFATMNAYRLRAGRSAA